MLLPGTLGRAWSKTNVTFSPNTVEAANTGRVANRESAMNKKRVMNATLWKNLVNTSVLLV
jgi:hypothetical protein